jgi:hypothetical protein
VPETRPPVEMSVSAPASRAQSATVAVCSWSQPPSAQSVAENQMKSGASSPASARTAAITSRRRAHLRDCRRSRRCAGSMNEGTGGAGSHSGVELSTPVPVSRGTASGCRKAGDDAVDAGPIESYGNVIAP